MDYNLFLICLFCVENFSINSRKIITFYVVFCQGFELLLSALGDPSERVVSATHQVFLPAYAAWTTELGNLQFHLIPTLLNKIEKLLRVCVFTLEGFFCIFITYAVGFF